MKVYVATKFENSKTAREAYEALRIDGHTITHDWTWEHADDLEEPVRSAYLRACAEKDTTGVLDCEGFLLFNFERIAGGYSEFGMAVAKKRLGHPVCIVIIDGYHPEKPHNIFFKLPDVFHAKDLSEARAIFKAFQVLLDRERRKNG